MALRVGILGVLALVVFCALFFRLWALQVISGERYLENANNNQIRSFGVIAPRGSVVDRDGDIARLQQAGHPGADLAGRAGEAAGRRARADAAPLSPGSSGSRCPTVRARRWRSASQSDPLTPVTIDTSVGELKTAYLMEHQGEFPGVQISETYLRNYEQGALAPQILGYVGRDRRRAARGEGGPGLPGRRPDRAGRGSRPSTTPTCAACAARDASSWTPSAGSRASASSASCPSRATTSG